MAANKPHFDTPTPSFRTGRRIINERLTATLAPLTTPNTTGSCSTKYTEESTGCDMYNDKHKIQYNAMLTRDQWLHSLPQKLTDISSAYTVSQYFLNLDITIQSSK